MTSMPEPEQSDGNYENLTTLDGDRVVKTYTRRERFDAEHRSLQVLATCDLAPRILEVDTDRLVIVTSRVHGRRPEAGDLERVGTALATWHSLTRRACRTELAEFDVVDDFTRRIQSRCRGLFDADQLDRCRTWWTAAPSVLGRCSPTLLHHDVKPSNIVVTHDEVVFVDLDQSRFGDPLSDLGKAVWRMCHTTTERSRLFASYLGRGPDADDWRRVRFFEIAHAIGALAYWKDFRVESYRPHAISAAAIVRRGTGLEIDLDAIDRTEMSA